MLNEEDIRNIVDKVFDKLQAGKIHMPRSYTQKKPRATKKALTEKQRKLYNKLRANGISRDEILSIIKRD